MKRNIHALGAALLLAATQAAAWTDEANLGTPKDHPTCVPGPGAICSWGRLQGVQWAGKDLQEAVFTSARLEGANLQGANLFQANMQIANLAGANLSLANLEAAHLHAANLQKANMQLANMQRVNLLDADLRGANLRGANLQGAILIAAKFDGATWTDGRVCAAGSVGECR